MKDKCGLGMVYRRRQRADTINNEIRDLYITKGIALVKRQVAPKKMVQELDKENPTTILKDMIEQAELKNKYKYLQQLEKSKIEKRIDTAVPQENDGIF